MTSERQTAVCRLRLRHGLDRVTRAVETVPPVRRRRRRRRRHLRQRLDRSRSAVTRISTNAVAIYRIAPKGFASKPPAFDLATIDGADHGAGLASGQRPRHRLRSLEGARRVGGNPVAGVQGDPNPFIRGRAIFLLYQLGPEGIKRAGAPESDASWRCASLPIEPYAANLDVMPVAAKPARDKDPASAARWRLLRDVPAASTMIFLVEIARRYDGRRDRSYLDAFPHWGHRAKSRRCTTGCAQTSASSPIHCRGRRHAGLPGGCNEPAAVPDHDARPVDEAAPRRSRWRRRYARVHE